MTMMLPRLTCKRCGWEWIPRSDKLPARCPKCISPYWDKDRQKSAESAKAEKPA